LLVCNLVLKRGHNLICRKGQGIIKDKEKEKKEGRQQGLPTYIPDMKRMLN